MLRREEEKSGKASIGCVRLDWKKTREEGSFSFGREYQNVDFPKDRTRRGG